MSQPDLGTTWSEAVESAYNYGYNQFDNERNESLRSELRDVKSGYGKSFAATWAHNAQSFEMTVHEGRIHRELWNAIDEFFTEEMPQQISERYKREAAVAEEIDVAYEAGALDALLGIEKDVSEVHNLKAYDPLEA